MNIKAPKKLIEVALPLDDINTAAAYEKMPGIGPPPRGLHVWWARRPLGIGPTTTGSGGGQKSAPTQFYATVNLDPVKAKLDFAQVVDEVVQQFTTKPGASVTISVEIQAEDASGFDDNTQRAVRENCNVLKFATAEFEES